MTWAAGPARSIAFPLRKSLLKKTISRMGTPKTTTDRLAAFIATAAGAGLAPKAPGTAGSAAGILVYVLLNQAGAGAYLLLRRLGCGRG